MPRPLATTRSPEGERNGSWRERSRPSPAPWFNPLASKRGPSLNGPGAICGGDFAATPCRKTWARHAPMATPRDHAAPRVDKHYSLNDAVGWRGPHVFWHAPYKCLRRSMKKEMHSHELWKQQLPHKVLSRICGDRSMQRHAVDSCGLAIVGGWAVAARTRAPCPRRLHPVGWLQLCRRHLRLELDGGYGEQAPRPAGAAVSAP